MATTQKIKSTLNSWATLETPPSMFQRYLPEKLKPQLGHIFPFAYPRIGERVNSAFLRALGAEFLGTMLFMFILVSQVVFSCRGASCSLPDEEGYMATAATAGFTMFALIYATASFSGGHLNPAITLGALVANKITCMRAVAYMFMQIAGAIVGSAFVWCIASVGPAANVLSKTGRAGHAGGFMVEFLLTFALMFVTLAATDASRYKVTHLPILAPLAIGMVYLIAHMAAIPVDGCSINPARFLGTFTLSGVGGWASWVFFMGPIAGAVAAAFVYEFGFKPDYDEVLDLEGGASAAAPAAAAAVAPAK